MQSLKSDLDKQLETVATNALKPNRTAQVVVVGAGLAGLAAAQRLCEAGIRDVIILDAQSRVGGRVHTIEHGDYVLELGAQWLHGADDNPLHKWMREKNMLDDFEDASLGFQGLFCTNKGREVEQRLVKRVLDIVVEGKMSLFKNNCDESLQVGKSGGSTNAAQVFRRQLDAAVGADEELKRNERLVYAMFDWFLRYEVIENGCNSMDEVSVCSYTDWTDWGDGTLLNFKRGYRSLLHWFCSHMPAKRCVHLNKEVVSIETLVEDGAHWATADEREQHGKPMLVRYVDHSKEDKSGSHANFIECDHVIVTVSLGFLSNNYKSLFKPRLPEVKEDIIRSIGFGTVNKIILQFESPFWKDNHGIKLVWESERDDEFPVWVRDIVAFDVVRRQPHLLIGWIGGRGAKLVEQESDSDIVAVCQRLFDKFLPAGARVRPTRIVSCICTRWNSNRFVCGSYSFQSMQSYDLNNDKLHEPLYGNTDANKLVLGTSSRVPRVLFAGEATAGKLYSTTHGAIITGWREADRLKDHLLGGKKANIQRMSSNVNIISN